VDIDGLTLVVFEVVDRYPVASRPAYEVDRLLVADELGGLGEAATPLGEPRYERDEPQVRLAAQGLGEGLGDGRRPQVLVLDVDEAAGPPERLAIGAGDAPLTVGCEGGELREVT
jgi:hypothetical protein